MIQRVCGELLARKRIVVLNESEAVPMIAVIVGVLQHASFDPIGQRDRVEIDQQANPTIRESKVGQQLGLVGRQHPLDCFEFEDHRIVHDDVGDASAFHDRIVVVHIQSDLSPEWDACSTELAAKALLVYRFEEAWAEFAMDAHGQAYDPVGEIGRGEVVMLHGRDGARGRLDEGLSGGRSGAGIGISISTQITQITQKNHTITLCLTPETGASVFAVFIYSVQICVICVICVEKYSRRRQGAPIE